MQNRHHIFQFLKVITLEASKLVARRDTDSEEDFRVDAIIVHASVVPVCLLSWSAAGASPFAGSAAGASDEQAVDTGGGGAGPSSPRRRAARVWRALLLASEARPEHWRFRHYSWRCLVRIRRCDAPTAPLHSLCAQPVVLHSTVRRLVRICRSVPVFPAPQVQHQFNSAVWTLCTGTSPFACL